jgi:glycerophosphoryl diester phosphodiesterase
MMRLIELTELIALPEADDSWDRCARRTLRTQSAYPMPDVFGFDGAAEIIAHRGFSARAPENTLAAMDAAITAGADAIECDVHISADGVPVVLHDNTVNRTTNGSGAVQEMVLEDLVTLDAGSWFASAFAGEPIPALARVLERTGHRVARVYPEVKGYRNDRDLVRLIELVVEAHLEARTVFLSMDWHALDLMRAHRPTLNIGYIVEKASRADGAFARAEGDPHALLDFKAALLLRKPALAARAATLGIPLAAWTLDSPEEATRLFDLGVSRITTNEVAALVAWKQTR